MDCHTSFLKWKIYLTYLFSQFWQYNKSIYTNFHISRVKIHLQFLVFFFGFCHLFRRTILVLILCKIRFSMFPTLLFFSKPRFFLSRKLETGGLVGSFQNLSEYWTTCDHNQTEKMHYILSIMWYDPWSSQKHRYVNNRSFVLCTPLLTCVSHVVTCISSN